MQMASISRWTLAYFGCALMALVLALGLISSGFGYPAEGLAAPQTLIVVHLLAIGWLSLLMLGALYQFLPVLVGKPLSLVGLAPLVLVLLLVGLALLLGGFAGLEGLAFPVDLLPLGGLLLVCGFAIAAFILFWTLVQVGSLPLPAGFVAVALASLLLTALLGESLASALAGFLGQDLAAALLGPGVGLHAGFGLGGWLTFAAMGVSYRLVSMFLVAPERGGPLPRMAFWCGSAALAALCMALGLVLVNGASLPVVLAVAGLAALLSLLAYSGDIVALYSSRRRRALELHTGAAIAAFCALAAGALLLLAGFWLDSEGAIAGAIYLLALGWLGGLGLAMLYKIIPFLTWLECFAPDMGRLPTPRVQDLVCEARARNWFLVYFLGIVLATVALTLDLALPFQAGAVIQLAAVLGLIRQFYRARRLHDLPTAWHNHPRPRLFLPAIRQRSLS